VIKGRECSSLMRSVSPLGRTVFWTGGIAWREVAINISSKNMNEKRVCFNFRMDLPALYQHGSGPAGQAGNAECEIKNLKIKNIIFAFLNLKLKILIGCLKIFYVTLNEVKGLNSWEDEILRFAQNDKLPPFFPFF
jgi:hypothetical protein